MKIEVSHECDMSQASAQTLLRQIPDTRDYRCPQKFNDLEKIDNTKVSIVITYHNESLSILLRTIYSIYERTPLKYLQEIIVIDDCSDDDFIYQRLKQLACPPFNNHTFLKSQRNPRRLGLIKSRNMGARMARGNYLMFMDSHCEVNQQWLESLLSPMIASSTAMGKMAVSPLLDNIDAETGEYKPTEASIKGGFDWNLHFHWIARDKILNPFTTFRSPTFAGGVFLISRNWFFKLKAFNTRLEIWGGEALEFSLKLWLCGGEIRIVPCSRVGHIFRKEHVFKFPNDGRQQIYLRNSKVIAETWLDHFKYNFYNLRPAAKNIPVNISTSEIKSFKASLNCHNFEWYLNNVFPELRQPDKYTAYGTLSTSSTTNIEQCLHHDSNEFDEPIIVITQCFLADITKWFLMKLTSQLSTDKGFCLTIKWTSALKFLVILEKCFASKHQKWQRFGLQLRHDISGLCLETTVDLQLTLASCRREAPAQYFRFNREVEKL